jgi:hypothetical protein
MDKVTRQRTGLDRLKQQARRGKPPASGNRRLAQQTRKILRKHYASKYRVRRR